MYVFWAELAILINGLENLSKFFGGMFFNMLCILVKNSGLKMAQFQNGLVNKWAKNEASSSMSLATSSHYPHH